MQFLKYDCIIPHDTTADSSELTITEIYILIRAIIRLFIPPQLQVNTHWGPIPGYTAWQGVKKNRVSRMANCYKWHKGTNLEYVHGVNTWWTKSSMIKALKPAKMGPKI